MYQISCMLCKKATLMKSHQQHQIIFSHLNNTETFSRQQFCGKLNTEPSIPAPSNKCHPRRPVLLAEEEANHLGWARGETQ